MKPAWNINRLSVFLAIFGLLVASVGCDSPLMSLRSILSGRAITTASNYLFATIVAADNSDQQSSDDAQTAAKPTAEELVADWQKPEFALFVSGRQHGYIEPCGCTGLENQKGGLMRRHSAQKVLLNRGWDLVSIDAGNQIRRFGQQPTIKLRKTFESLCQIMNYSVIGIGPDDLKTPSIDIVQSIFDVQQPTNAFTCANVVIEDIDDGSLTSRYSVITKNGRRIGVTMVLGDDHVRDLQQVNGINVTPAGPAVAAAAQGLQNAGCDLKVLVAHASLEQCRQLAKQSPVFDLVITAGGSGDPTLQPEIIEAAGRATQMIQVGVKGMYVGIVAAYPGNNGQLNLKYERVPLDERFEDSEQMKQMFSSYQAELKGLWLAGALDDIRPRAHPSGHKFVGSESCADCHDEEYEIWAEGIDGEGGPHAKATRDLTNPGQRAWVQRHFDPECVSCHATGWNPQLYYPYESGYIDLKKHEALHGNGCENCHGPGSAHVAAENGDVDVSDDEIDKLRQEMVVTLAEARENMCMSCHDLDNSPDFVKEGGFDEYWPHIKHGGDE